MREAIEKVLETMREDYKGVGIGEVFAERDDSSAHYSDVKNKMEENYCSGLEVTEEKS